MQRTSKRHHHLSVITEPVDFDPDPYLVDEPALTLADWRDTALHDDGDIERVRLHQPHGARLVA